MRPPALRSCQATCHSSGPLPANTTRRSGTSAERLRSVCTPPAVTTPGSVQPGTGNGRSSVPVAITSARAAKVSATRAACRPPVTPRSNAPSSRRATAQTDVAGRYSVPAAWNARTVALPRQ